VLGNPRHDVRSVNSEGDGGKMVHSQCEEGDWEELRDDFYHSFSSLSHIVSLRSDILAFEQLENESIGSAWARFSHLLA
jgi:hypothetical protein